MGGSAAGVCCKNVGETAVQLESERLYLLDLGLQNPVSSSTPLIPGCTPLRSALRGCYVAHYEALPPFQRPVVEKQQASQASKAVESSVQRAREPTLSMF